MRCTAASISSTHRRAGSVRAKCSLSTSGTRGVIWATSRRWNIPIPRWGNMNEHSLIITETTYGGRGELADSTGRMDYGSMIYITLQRARTAREAIPRDGRSGRYLRLCVGRRVVFDRRCGRGVDHGGDRQGFRTGRQGRQRPQRESWVARRIPDGYVSGHANQARITTFPLDDPDNCPIRPT